MVNCNTTSVHDCLTKCPVELCNVRNLRNTVKDPYVQELVELALDEHWNQASTYAFQILKGVKPLLN